MGVNGQLQTVSGTQWIGDWVCLRVGQDREVCTSNRRKALRSASVNS